MGDPISSPTTSPEVVLATAKKMLEEGLVEGTSGNISGRLPDGQVCLTPSSVAYDTMTLDDLVIVDLDGTVVSGHRSPTTEKDLHLSTLRAYPELGAVIHTHAVHATMFALAHEAIPAVIEEVVVYVGGDVPCCEYKGTGTADLGDEVAAHLHDRGAALLANHGLVTCASTPEKALHNAALVERTAQIIWGARAMGATINPLPEKVNRDMAGVYRFIRENPVTAAFTADERIVVAAALDACVPGTSDLGGVDYVEGLLTALDHEPPRIWAAPGDWAGDGPRWLEVGPWERQAWAQRIEAWRAVYQRIVAGTGDARDERVVHEHACEATYGDPAYGGNRDSGGWVRIDFPEPLFPPARGA